MWGLIPLGVTIFVALAAGIVSDLSNDLRVGATVLALTLCGTQLVDDLPIPQKQLKKWKWLRNFSLILIVFGAVVAALNVLHSANISLGSLNIDLRFLNKSASWVFLAALIISFLAFLIRVVAAGETFEQAVDERRRTLSKNAASQNEVDGIKL
ncbi:MAG: hypothetical protein CL626_03180 [Aurantimonas sp.]|nr:hypothetical protein [Aurantimonas sp.]